MEYFERIVYLPALKWLIVKEWNREIKGIHPYIGKTPNADDTWAVTGKVFVDIGRLFLDSVDSVSLGSNIQLDFMSVGDKDSWVVMIKHFNVLTLNLIIRGDSSGLYHYYINGTQFTFDSHYLEFSSKGETTHGYSSGSRLKYEVKDGMVHINSSSY